ncbi:MAG: hypothetical protein ACRECD_03285 [Burkholderiaceae bacterium]
MAQPLDCRDALRGWGCAWLAACMLAGPALAEDRHFLRLDTALVEDDDDRSFEVSTRLSQTRDERALQASVEYNFSPTLAAELQMGRANERGGPGRKHELELGMRHVLIDHNREGWGLAYRLSLGWEKLKIHSWAFEGPTAVAAFVWPLTGMRGNLHANLGLSRENSAGNTRVVWGVGVDAPVARSLVLFGELGGRVTEDRLTHGGNRWWVKREKVAFDVSLSRTRLLATGDRRRGAGRPCRPEFFRSGFLTARGDRTCPKTR